MFKKGQSGNPAGRKLGTKNKNCMNAVFWFNMLDDCLKCFSEKERTPHVFRALELLMPKVPALPATPTESASNASKAWETLNGLAPAEKPVESNPSPVLSDPVATGNGDNGFH